MISKVIVGSQSA